MNSQLMHTVATLTAMTAYALVVGSIAYFLCLFLKKLGVLKVLDLILIFAWFVIFLISSETFLFLLLLCGVASFCALLKTPDNKIWKSNFRFLLTSGSSSFIFGSMLLGLISSYVPAKFQVFGQMDTQFLLLVSAPCAISAMHSVLANSWLRPGIDRHLREGEAK